MDCECRITADDLPTGVLGKMLGPKPPRDFVSNGCTHAPDFLFGADLRPACHVHDYHYSICRDETERRLADGFLYRNVYVCCLRSTGLAGRLPALVAGVYFRRVRLWGEFYQHYHAWYVRPVEFIKHFVLRHCETLYEWRRVRKENFQW